MEHNFLSGRRILPAPITAGISVVDLVEGAFLAYNGRRLREACRLFARRMLEPEVTVGRDPCGRADASRDGA